MRRTAIIIAIIVLIASAGVASAQVATTKHDLRTLTGQDEICVTCHAPHLPAANLTTPLWNHTESTEAYQVYTSPTMDSTAGPATSGTAVSNLCLSCHDGSVAVGSYYNGPTPVYTTGTWNVSTTGLITGIANMGTDLRNDHPVDMTYADAETGGGMKAEAAVTVPLYGGTVQCGSCHDPHDNTTAQPFLRIDNTGSALCLDCHVK